MLRLLVIVLLIVNAVLWFGLRDSLDGERQGSSARISPELNPEALQVLPPGAELPPPPAADDDELEAADATESAEEPVAESDTDASSRTTTPEAGVAPGAVTQSPSPVHDEATPELGENAAEEIQNDEAAGPDRDDTSETEAQVPPRPPSSSADNAQQRAPASPWAEPEALRTPALPSELAPAPALPKTQETDRLGPAVEPTSPSPSPTDNPAPPMPGTQPPAAGAAAVPSALAPVADRESGPFKTPDLSDPEPPTGAEALHEVMDLPPWEPLPLLRSHRFDTSLQAEALAPTPESERHPVPDRTVE